MAHSDKCPPPYTSAHCPAVYYFFPNLTFYLENGRKNLLNRILVDVALSYMRLPENLWLWSGVRGLGCQITEKLPSLAKLMFPLMSWVREPEATGRVLVCHVQDLCRRPRGQDLSVVCADHQDYGTDSDQNTPSGQGFPDP